MDFHVAGGGPEEWRRLPCRGIGPDLAIGSPQASRAEGRQFEEEEKWPLPFLQSPGAKGCWPGEGPLAALLFPKRASAHRLCTRPREPRTAWKRTRSGAGPPGELVETPRPGGRGWPGAWAGGLGSGRKPLGLPVLLRSKVAGLCVAPEDSRGSGQEEGPVQRGTEEAALTQKGPKRG